MNTSEDVREETTMSQIYQLSALDFLALIRRKRRYVLACGAIGAIGLVSALGVSSRSSTEESVSSPTPTVVGQPVVFLVDGFATLRQALSLVGVTEDATAKLFFPANSDVVKEFEANRAQYDTNNGLRTCEFQSPSNFVVVKCMNRTVSIAHINRSIQGAYNALFEERLGPIADLLARIKDDVGLNQSSIVRDLLASPVNLSVKKDTSELTVGAPAVKSTVSPMSFTLRNAIALGVGGFIVGYVCGLLLLFVIGIKSKRILSIEGLKRATAQGLPVFDLNSEGPELVGLQTFQGRDRSSDQGFQILALDGVDESTLFRAWSEFCVSKYQTGIEIGTANQLIKKLSDRPGSSVIVVGAIGATTVADMQRVIRAAELSAREVAGVVGVTLN